MKLSSTLEPLRGWWNRYRQRNLQIHEWSDLPQSPHFQGRSLAIVGNAGYLRECEQGAQIDQCDLVLRMNNFETAGFERSVGQRTDIFLSTFHNDVKLANPQLMDVPLVVAAVPNNLVKPAGSGYRYRHGEYIAHGMARLAQREVYTPSLARFTDYRTAIGRYPTTGAMAILLALDCLMPAIERLLITGFSFFTGPSHYFSERVVRPNNHDLDRERIYLRERLLPYLETGAVEIDPHMAAHLFSHP